VDLPSLGVEVRVSDIAVEAPGESVYDLVHERGVLIWLRAWERAIEHMVAAVRPGGLDPVGRDGLGVTVRAYLA
jgi:hypothetical protein